MQKLILFGAGFYGLRALKFLGRDKVAALCDNDKGRLVKLSYIFFDIGGVELLDLKGLVARGVHNDEIVAITPLDDSVSDEIKNQLAEHGISSIRLWDIIDKEDLLAERYENVMGKDLLFDLTRNDRYDRLYFILPHEHLQNNKLGETQYYSQENQDIYFDNFIFNRKENGVFLDIGANDPIFINNTYFFEKERGWTGLAFEPNPKKFDLWAKQRKTKCINVALGAYDGEQAFVEYEEDYMSGLKYKVDFNGKIAKEYKVPVRRIADILKNNGIDKVDFVSLDVEGAELDVLKGFDFNSCRIDYFCVECDKKVNGYPVRRFLASNGYKLIARMWHDDIWNRE